MTERRIGLFGGSFEPVHLAHLALAHVALDHLRLDELRWIPTGEPWQKTRRVSPAADRIAMLKLATADEPRFTIDDLETRRTGPSYTLDTVRELMRRERAEWFLVIGQDQCARLDTWHGWQELLPLVTLAVAGRAGEAPRPPRVVEAFFESTGTPRQAHSLPLPDLPVSATDIRSRVSRGEGIAGWVPASVASYIEQHALYRVHTGN